MKFPTTISSAVKSLTVLSITTLSAFANEAGKAGAFQVHEWGTFTTVSGSDGKLLTGLEREEEYLPYFVQGHAGVNRRRGKGFYFPLRGVTVKMETPVIYFYGEPQKNVNVKVGFNGGSISQWYPPRTGGEVAPKIPKRIEDKVIKGLWSSQPSKLIDFSEGYDGAIEWDAEILERDEVDSVKYYKPHESKSWIYPAVPESNIVKVGETYEQYLFYRGLGNFSLPVTFTVNDSEVLNIQNSGDEKVPYLFVFEKTREGGVRYQSMTSGLEGKKSVNVSEGDLTVVGKDEVTEVIFTEVRKGLMAQGLTESESNGMIKTWWNSYFGHDGLRVFWVVPTQETERILPLSISPKPESITRVIVGRSEVMRPRFEKKLLTDNKKDLDRLIRYDRFGLAYQQRVLELRKVNKEAIEPVNIKSADLTLGDEHAREQSTQSPGGGH